MKITIDARTYFLRSGIGRYTRGVIKALADEYPNDEFVLLISNRKRADDFPLAHGNLDVRVSQADLNDFEQEKKILYHEMAKSGGDIMYFPFYILPGIFKRPAITTIFDLTFLRYPKFHLQTTIDYLSSYIESVISGADKIITISDYVRQDVMSYADDHGLPLDDQRIVRVYPGVDDRYFDADFDGSDSSTLGKYGLKSGDYLLYVGSIEPRKNVSSLLKAYDSVDVDIPLVIVGLERWLPERFKETVSSLRSTEKIYFLGFVADEDLPSLYRGSLCVVYPSFSEGFGFPVAEAYACGTPVITSDNSSMKEIGIAAVLTDPGDTVRIGESILRVINDENLRNRLVERGAGESVKYRWGRCAKELMTQFLDAVENPRKT